MISNVKICALKSIVDLELNLGKLTLLSGLNSSGKSTFLQGIKSACLSGGTSRVLKGLGGFDELYSRYAARDGRMSVEVYRDQDCSARVSARRAPILWHVVADRIGPRAFYPLNEDRPAFPAIGDRGEYVFEVLERMQGAIVPEGLRHPLAQGDALEYQVEAWLQEVSPGVKLKYSIDSKRDSAYCEINSFRTANVGYGLTYSLSVIVAVLCLSVEEWLDDRLVSSGGGWLGKKQELGVLLLLENPEAHLHPQGQTAMGRMLALAADVGVQIVVETHSDHVMDGIRLAVKAGDIGADDVLFHYFSIDGGVTKVRSPKIYADGKLEFWPEGFFDQTLKNRAALAKRG